MTTLVGEELERALDRIDDRLRDLAQAREELLAGPGDFDRARWEELAVAAREVATVAQQFADGP